MAESNENLDFNKMREREKALIAEYAERFNREADEAAARAKADQGAEGAGAYADYAGYGGGFASETNKARGYNAYRNRLASVAKAAQASAEKTDLYKQDYQTQKEVQDLRMAISEFALRNSD